MQNNSLPPGHSSVEEAVALIKTDTRQNPVVDMDYIAHKAIWIEPNRNFRIPLVKRLPKDKIYRTRRGKTIEYERTGSMTVKVNTNFDKELLKKTIYDKYRELVGREYQQINVRAMSTVADDAQGKEAVRPRRNKPIAKEGANIGDGTTMTSNGEGLQV